MSERSDASVAPEEAERQLLGLALLGAAIGIPAAFVAAAFFAIVHLLQEWL
jgi:hypothetical protein